MCTTVESRKQSYNKEALNSNESTTKNDPMNINVGYILSSYNNLLSTVRDIHLTSV